MPKKTKPAALPTTLPADLKKMPMAVTAIPTQSPVQEIVLPINPLPAVNKGGRPRKKPINRELVMKLAATGHTVNEIAELTGVGMHRLTHNARTEIQRGMIQRDASVRRKQFEVAM